MIDVTEQEFGFLSEMERYDTFLALYHSTDPADAQTLERLYRGSDPLVPLMLMRYLEDIPEKRACLTIIRCVEAGEDIVAKAAMDAFRLSHYPQKAHLLKPLILSKKFRACRFAVKTLSRAGFMDVLPLILREIPDRSGPIQNVMIDSLRYLPHRRSVPTLTAFANSEHEPTRFLVVSVLSELQFRTRALAPAFFLRKLNDESARVRSAALEALQRLPDKKVAPMILKGALDENEPEATRVRSVRAMSAFPSLETVHTLVGLSSKTKSSAIRISCEIVLRSYPPRVLRGGLIPLLDGNDPTMRRQATVFLAEFLGSDPSIRKLLHDLWKNADEDFALDLIEMMRILGQEETVLLLSKAIYGSPIVGYAAATALSQMRGVVAGQLLLEIIQSSEVTALVKQALLDRWAKRGPDARIKDAAMPLLLEMLTDFVMNVRYLSAQVLGWYPLEKTLVRMLDLLANESDPEVANVAGKIIMKGLSNDPMPLVNAIKVHPRREALAKHLVKIISARRWDPEKAHALLETLSTEPISLSKLHPKRFAGVCLHLFEHGTVTLPDVWPRLVKADVVGVFLRMMVTVIANPRRRFSPLPLAFLELQATLSDKKTRSVLYEAMAVEKRDACAEFLAAALLRETDPGCREKAKGLLKGLFEVEDAS
ncbi:MAG: hypothetical protein COB53_04075 [Elusimicrobia bacterium]|nr:MAG: hypothetical protein COB53_04075 [Elusimicrobiota bacterium]